MSLLFHSILETKRANVLKITLKNSLSGGEVGWGGQLEYSIEYLCVKWLTHTEYNGDWIRKAGEGKTLVNTNKDNKNKAETYKLIMRVTKEKDEW